MPLETGFKSIRMKTNNGTNRIYIYEGEAILLENGSVEKDQSEGLRPRFRESRVRCLRRSHLVFYPSLLESVSAFTYFRKIVIRIAAHLALRLLSSSSSSISSCSSEVC
jgi:hypothetical protein